MEVMILRKYIDIKSVNHKDYSIICVCVKDKDMDWHIHKIYSEYDDYVPYDSVMIAKALNAWDSKYSSRIDTETESYECECCGWYENETVTIQFHNKKLKDIILYNDRHLGYCKGLSEEETIEAWKENGITIIYKTEE